MNGTNQSRSAGSTVSTPSVTAPMDGGLSDVEIDMNCAVLGLMAIITVAGNALILLAFVRNERLRTVSNKFVVSLAVSDLLVGTITVPIWMHLSLSRWKVAKTVNDFFQVIDVLSATCSMLHFTCISVERFVAISRPFYHQTIPQKVYPLVIAVLWILSTSLSVLMFSIQQYPHFRLLFLLVLSAGSVLLISGLNVGVYRIAKRLIHATPSYRTETTQEFEMKRFVRRERKVAVTLAIITGIFFITWLPQMAVSITYNICTPPACTLGLSPSAEQWLGVFVKWMQFANSAINPVVFAFRDVEMRRTFARILGPALKLVLCCKRRVQPAPGGEQWFAFILRLMKKNFLNFLWS